jgi:glucan phosphoethanolaminetransferase (alkaline phosphatase superfamily)
VPKSVVQSIQYPPDEKSKAAVFALLVIFFLVFALRGLPDLQAGVFAGGFSGFMAFLVNQFSERLKIQLHQNVLISGFSTVAVTLLFALCIQTLSNYYFENIYHIVSEAVAENVNPKAVLMIPAALAVVPTLVLWLIKVRFIDWRKLTRDGFVYAGSITLAGGVVVALGSIISDPLFEGGVNLLQYGVGLFGLGGDH